MQGFISGALSSGASAKRFGSDFGGPITRGTATGNIGNNLRQRFDTTPGAPLRKFETESGFHTEGSNPFAPPMHSTEDVNPRITIQGRRIMPFAATRLGMADLGPPVERQLAFVWRVRPSGGSDNVSVKTGQPNFLTSMYGAPQMSMELPGNSAVKVQIAPALAAEPCALNFAWADLQRQWAEVDGGKHYLRITNEMLFYGARHLEGIFPKFILDSLKKLPGFSDYEGFDLDGIPRNTIAEDGTAPQYNDGIVRGHREDRAAKTYAVAMTSRGAEMCLDYWNSAGLEAGTLLYIIIKKNEIDKYTHRTKSNASETDHKQYLVYDLATKAHDLYRDGASMRRELKMPKIRVGGEDVFMTPSQLHFVSSRTTLDREHAKYVDELGITRYGLVIYVGTVLHPPPSGRMNPPTKLGESRPYMSNRHAMQNEPFEIILNPDSGIRCAL
jgi:hypothetical protein